MAILNIDFFINSYFVKSPKYQLNIDILRKISAIAHQISDLQILIERIKHIVTLWAAFRTLKDNL